MYRYNAMNLNSVKEFCNIRGGFNFEYRDVYFLRILGLNENLKDEIINIDFDMDKYSEKGQMVYKRVNELPVLSEIQKADYYAECYDKWLRGGKKSIIIQGTRHNLQLQMRLSEACNNTLNIYMNSKKGMSDSIVKNYVVKLMYWFDFVFNDSLIGWNERSFIKIIKQNVIKEQEYLFFYMLTQIGADVLLIQTIRDIEMDNTLMRLSRTIKIGNYVNDCLPAYETIKHDKENESQHQHSKKDGNSKDKVMMVIPKHAHRKEKITGTGLQTQQSYKRKESCEKDFEELALLASSIVMIAKHDSGGDIIGTGSGIMIGRGGYILTNNHVASGGQFYSVRVEDDEEIYTTDEVIKYNSVLDLAVIRIKRRLDTIPIYKGKEKLVRGQKVVAIGSPLGLFNSVSNGIISGFRIIDSVDMIQFTAPISHGSSGGAVLNMNGEVIGISTAGIDSGQNINLAVGYECINTFIQGFTSE